MAYMSQERKKDIAANLKKIMPKGWKYSVGVNHNSTIVLTIWSAPVDLVAEWNRVTDEHRRGEEHINRANGHIRVNHYYLENQFDESLPTLKAANDCLFAGNHDNSDAMIDHFDVGWYVSINIGKWDKPFRVS